MGAACSAATPDPSLRYASSGGAAAAPQARLDCAAFAFRHAGAVADVSAACGAIATAGEDGALAERRRIVLAFGHGVVWLRIVIMARRWRKPARAASSPAVKPA